MKWKKINQAFFILLFVSTGLRVPLAAEEQKDPPVPETGEKVEYTGKWLFTDLSVSRDNHGLIHAQSIIVFASGTNEHQKAFHFGFDERDLNAGYGRKSFVNVNKVRGTFAGMATVTNRSSSPPNTYEVRMLESVEPVLQDSTDNPLK